MRAVFIFAACLSFACEAPPEQPPAPFVPCTSSPTTVDFGETDATIDGASVRTRIRVRNHSGSDRNLTLRALGKPFSVLPIPGAFKLPAGSTRELTVFFTPTDGMLHLDELALFEDVAGDGSCEVRVPLRGLGGGNLSLGGTPAPLDFGFMEPGARQTLTFAVTNSTRAPIRLDSVSVVFDMGFSLPEPVTITEAPTRVVPASGTLGFELVAAPQQAAAISGRVVIRSGFTLLEAPFTLRVGVPEPELFPASVGPWLVGFEPSSDPPTFSNRAIRLRNVGSSGPSADAGLRLLSVQIAGFSSDSRELQVNAPPAAFLGLASGESAELVLHLEPRSEGPRAFLVTLVTNSPTAPRVTLPVQAQVQALPRCELSVSPSLELRLLPIDEGRVAGSVNFTNVGVSPCTVDDVRLTGGAENAFTIASGQVTQVHLLPGQQYTAIIVGPRSSTVTHVGGLSFHVFNANSRVERVDLYSTP